MGKLLFRMARLKILGVLVGFVLAYLPFLVPVKKVMQNKRVMAFKHPAPSYSGHVLIIPRKVAQTVFHLTSDDFAEVMAAAETIRQGGSQDFVLVINGGARQDVMQAHFHLFTGNLAKQKTLVNNLGAAHRLTDAAFDLRHSLRQHKVSESAFTIVIQFESYGAPTVYFM